MGAKLKSRLQSEERNVLDPFFSTLELVFWAISSSLPWPTVPTGSLISKQIGIIYIYIKLNIQYIYICVYHRWNHCEDFPRPDWKYPSSHGTSTNKRSLSQPLCSMKNVRNHQFSCQTCQTCTCQSSYKPTINLHLNHADSLRYLPVLNSWLHVPGLYGKEHDSPKYPHFNYFMMWMVMVMTVLSITAIFCHHSNFKGNAVSSCHSLHLFFDCISKRSVSCWHKVALRMFAGRPRGTLNICLLKSWSIFLHPVAIGTSLLSNCIVKKPSFSCKTDAFKNAHDTSCFKSSATLGAQWLWGHGSQKNRTQGFFKKKLKQT